jgi:hypothetical protein
MGKSFKSSVMLSRIARTAFIGSGLLLAACSGESDAMATGDAAAREDAQAGPTAAPEAAANAINANDRAAILRAAGFAQRGGKWIASCDEEGGSDFDYEGVIGYTGDLTGDGSPEAIVDGESSACFGNTGNSFVVVSKVDNAWKAVMEEVIGYAQVFRQGAGKLPLVEIGGPGSSCFPAYRWDGEEFGLAAFSIGGEICEELKPSKIGGLPIGYYANAQFCAMEITEVCVAYLGEDRLIEAGSGDFVSMRPTGSTTFQLTQSFPAEDGGPPSRSTNAIEITGPTGFRYLNSDYYFLQRDRVPAEARLLDLPHYRTDPRFRAVRTK